MSRHWSRAPHFWAAIALGPLAWFALDATRAFEIAWPPSLGARASVTLVLAIVGFPIVEEIVFRGLLQPALARRWRFNALPGISAANFHTSLAFAAAHLLTQPPALAGATFFPSLVFGYCRDRFASVVPGTIVHIVYNAGFFLLLRAT